MCHTLIFFSKKNNIFNIFLIAEIVKEELNIEERVRIYILSCSDGVNISLWKKALIKKIQMNKFSIILIIRIQMLFDLKFVFLNKNDKKKKNRTATKQINGKKYENLKIHTS